MFLSILIILVALLIAYFHLTQGFFSAGLSAILCVFSVLVALGFHETMVDTLLAGRFADQAHAISMMVIFAAMYSILRFVFDKAVPGNLRFPVLVDKIGAGLCGLVAGVFVGGLVAIAAQTLPYGPWVGGHDRYEVKEGVQVTMTVPGMTRRQDMVVDQLNAEKFTADPDEPQRLLLPADDIVLSLLKTVSDEKNALSTGKPFGEAHPDYLKELFGQRIGIQLAAKHAALKGKVEVKGVFVAGALAQIDQEAVMLNGTDPIGTRQDQAKRPKGARLPKPGMAFLVVRAELSSDLAEKNGWVMFSPASVRVAAQGKNYFPIGTLEGPIILFVNQPDDNLFVNQGNQVDLVFEVDKDLVRGEQVVPDVLFEFKRLARVDIGGKKVGPVVWGAEQVAKVEVLRRENVAPKREGIKPPTLAQQPQPIAPNTPQATGVPLDFSNYVSTPGALLPFPVASGTTNAEDPGGLAVWGTFALKANRFISVDMIPAKDTKLTEITTGAGQVTELGAPDGKQVLIVWGRAPQGGEWAWSGSLSNFSVTDKAGAKSTPAGFVVKGKMGGEDTMVIQYDVAKPIAFTPDKGAGITPVEVGLVFLIGQGQAPANLEYNGGVVKPLSN